MMYADRHGFDPVLADAFLIIIREMDAEYRKWHDEEAKKKAEQSKRGKGK